LELVEGARAKKHREASRYVRVSSSGQGSGGYVTSEKGAIGEKKGGGFMEEEFSRGGGIGHGFHLTCGDREKHFRLMGFIYSWGWERLPEKKKIEGLLQCKGRGTHHD